MSFTSSRSASKQLSTQGHTEKGRIFFFKWMGVYLGDSWHISLSICHQLQIQKGHFFYFFLLAHQTNCTDHNKQPSLENYTHKYKASRLHASATAVVYTYSDTTHTHFSIYTLRIHQFTLDTLENHVTHVVNIHMCSFHLFQFYHTRMIQLSSRL